MLVELYEKKKLHRIDADYLKVESAAEGQDASRIIYHTAKRKKILQNSTLYSIYNITTIKPTGTVNITYTDSTCMYVSCIPRGMQDA